MAESLILECTKHGFINWILRKKHSVLIEFSLEEEKARFRFNDLILFGDPTDMYRCHKETLNTLLRSGYYIKSNKFPIY